MLKITLKRSFIGTPEKVKRVVRSLGLRRIGQNVMKPDNPSVQGMISKVTHLVDVEKLET